MIYSLSNWIVMVYYINRSDLVSCVIFHVIFFTLSNLSVRMGCFFMVLFGLFGVVDLPDLGAPGAYCR